MGLIKYKQIHTVKQDGNFLPQKLCTTARYFHRDIKIRIINWLWQPQAGPRWSGDRQWAGGNQAAAACQPPEIQNVFSAAMAMPCSACAAFLSCKWLLMVIEVPVIVVACLHCMYTILLDSKSGRMPRSKVSNLSLKPKLRPKLIPAPV